MYNLNSRFFNFINILLIKFRIKLLSILDESFILKNIDNIIFFFILLLLLGSSIMETGFLGLLANIIFILTFVKIILVKNQRIKISFFGLILFVYFIFVFISTINSSLILPSLMGFLKNCTYIGFYFSCVYYFKDNKEKIPYLLLAISFVVFYESIIGLLQKLSTVRQIATWQDVSALNPEQVLTRVYGTLKPFNPNLLGGYILLASLAPMGLFLINLNKSNNIKWYFLLVYIFSIYIIIQTGSRGAYLGLFGTICAGFILLFNFFKSKKIKTILKNILYAITTVFFVAFLTIQPFYKRVMSIFTLREDSSTSFRLNVYEASYKMFQDNFLFGIGPGNNTFREIYGLYMKSGFDALSSYNLFLEIAVENGIFSLIFFIVFISLLVFASIKYIFSNNIINNKIFIFISLLAIIATITHGFFDTVFFRPQVQFLFWFYVAITVTYITSNNKQKSL